MIIICIFFCLLGWEGESMEYLIYNPDAFDQRVQAMKKWRSENPFDYTTIDKVINDEMILATLDSFTRAVDNLILFWDEFNKNNLAIDRRASVFWAIEVEVCCYVSYCKVSDLNCLDENRYEDSIYELYKWIAEAHKISQIYLSSDELNELTEISDSLDEMYDKDEEDYSEEEKELLDSLKDTKWYEEWFDDWNYSLRTGGGTDFLLDLFEEEDNYLKLVDYFAKR